MCTVGAELTTKSLSKAVEPCLRCTICWCASGGYQRETGSDKDNCVQLWPTPESLTGEVNGRAHVDREFVVQVFSRVGTRGEVAINKNSGIVDEHIEFPKTIDDGLQHRVSIFGNSDICSNGEGTRMALREAVECAL